MNRHGRLSEPNKGDARQSAPNPAIKRSLMSLVSGLICLGLVACGGGGDSRNSSTDSMPVPGLSFIAGNAEGYGSRDGTTSVASFDSPTGITSDSAGNLYVVDSTNATIRKITPAGVVTTLAGSAEALGSADGIGAAARFDYPLGITADVVGNLYVTDDGNQTIRKITPDGMVSTLAGQAGTRGSADGMGALARFNNPSGITADAAGNLYVVDGNSKKIRKITPAGMVTTLAGSDATGDDLPHDGTAATARFSFLGGITCDSAGMLYVTDDTTIRKVTPDGTVTTLAGIPFVYGSVDGPIETARFVYPRAISRDGFGNLYVGDNNTIRKITSAGMVTTVAGMAGVSGRIDGVGASARFQSGPSGIAVDASGNLYISDSRTIRKVTSAGAVTTLAGTVPLTGTTDGIGAAARFMWPTAITADPTGNLYVADMADSPSIRKITPSGVVSTLAGIEICPKVPVSSLGHLPSPYASLPSIAVDARSNIYLTSPVCGNVIKMLPTGVVETLAGIAGNSGTTDGLGSDARFLSPRGIASDLDGNLYVTDNATIRKITPAGMVTTLAGMAGVSGVTDGIGASARFGSLGGIAADKAGNLYVVDSYSTIRKVTPEGVVTTLAGTPGVIGSADGTGPNASFGSSSAITVDFTGNVYVAETPASTIRKISPEGAVTTVAGVLGRHGILLGNLPGELYYPMGVTTIGPNTLAVTTGASVLTLTLP